MFLNSIRWRLQLWHGLLLVLVLAGFGLTAYQLQRATLLGHIDEELQQRVTVAAGLMRRPNPEPGHPPFERFGPPNRGPGLSEDELPERHRGPRLNPQGLKLFEDVGTNAFYYVIWTRSGQTLSKSDTAPDTVPWPGAAALRIRDFAPRPEPNQTRSRGNQREIFHYSPPGDCILAGVNIGSEISEMHRFAGLLLAAGSLVLAFGLAGGWWASTRAIRPIKTISAIATKIATGDLSQRIPVEHSENELDQLAAVLNSTFARLEAAFGQQAQFTSDAAHELRTPVSVMLSQTQSILARERSSAEYCETLQACQRAAERMRRLIESLLELARLDAGQEQMKKEEVDLDGIIDECVELLRPLAGERKISIRLDSSGGHCVGDADRLKQVFTNLISNAIQYNRESGQVEIAIEQSSQTAVVSVKDTGVGISSDNLPRVFERFWRVDQSRTYANGHSGLGLSIVRSILDVHGGSIEVASEVEQGTTFIVRLPTQR